MAKKSQSGENKTAYFKQLFEENPEWLKLTSNKDVYDRWKADHNGEEMSQNDKATMANVKSVLRKKEGIQVKKAKKGGRKKASASASASTSKAPKATAPSTTRRIGVGDAEKLEHVIDDALSLARTMNVDGIDTIIKHLRKARNNIVLMFDLGKE